MRKTTAKKAKERRKSETPIQKKTAVSSYSSFLQQPVRPFYGERESREKSA